MEQKNEILISVIVPIYNTEKYLPDCLESIVNQSVNSIEIILIDDGSTDSSGRICDYYATRDGRIRVIHQINGGVSSARNAGLKSARGKYIAFVDSDDKLEWNMLDNLLREINGYCLAMGSHMLMSEEGDLQTSNIVPNKEVFKDKFINDLFEEKEFSYLGFLWDKLFVRKIIIDNKIIFDENISLNEDRLFLLEYLLKCEKIKLYDKIIYFYRQKDKKVVNANKRNIIVTNGEMTVLESFEKMKTLCKGYSDEVYYLCVRKAFESALDLLNRVSKSDLKKTYILKVFLWKNGKLCLKNPEYTILEKIKIIVHCILRK